MQGRIAAGMLGRMTAGQGCSRAARQECSWMQGRDGGQDGSRDAWQQGCRHAGQDGSRAGMQSRDAGQVRSAAAGTQRVALPPRGSRGKQEHPGKVGSSREQPAPAASAPSRSLERCPRSGAGEGRSGWKCDARPRTRGLRCCGADSIPPIERTGDRHPSGCLVPRLVQSRGCRWHPIARARLAPRACSSPGISPMCPHQGQLSVTAALSHFHPQQRAYSPPQRSRGPGADPPSPCQAFPLGWSRVGRGSWRLLALQRCPPRGVSGSLPGAELRGWVKPGCSSSDGASPTAGPGGRGRVTQGSSAGTGHRDILGSMGRTHSVPMS